MDNGVTLTQRLEAQDGDALTIVIVNWNGGELLLRCLDSIRASQVPFPVKVIVVDNNSADGSRERAQREFPEFTVINSGGNLGFGRGNNQARPLVDTPMVLFLNPDTELRPDTLQRVVECLESRSDVGALGCKMVYPDGTVQEQGLQWFSNPATVFLELLLPEWARRGWVQRLLPRVDPLQSGEVGKLYGGFILARREVLERAGWFDERYFMYAEDGDLSRTIRELGWKLHYCAEAEIVHACGGSSERAPSGFSILMKQRSVNQLIKKYHGPFWAFMHRLAVATAAGIRLVTLAVMWPGLRLLGRPLATWRLAYWKSQLLLKWAWGLKSAPIPKQPMAETLSATEAENEAKLSS
jgi:N-acetylglucosaminyl-diphospho-decaprenol L-rhamnosyltransferase